VAEYQSTPEVSTISDLSDGQSIDLVSPLSRYRITLLSLILCQSIEESSAGVVGSQEVYGCVDEWGALSGSENCTQSPKLLDLDEDHEMDFEAVPDGISPIQSTVSTPSTSASEQRPRRRRKVMV